MLSESLKEKVDGFLQLRRIAVCGVSPGNSSSVANIIYKKLNECGYTVYGVNPKATGEQGDERYPDLSSIPERVDGVVAAVPPEATLDIAKECRELGIRYLWLHRSFGTGSVSMETVNFCFEKGITVIGGACPMMFCEPVDVGHKCIKGLLSLTGKMPA